MISKLHTKLAFNTISNITTHLKTIVKHGFLAIGLAFFTFIANTTIAHAELVDLSNPEPVIQLSTRDASWLRPPRFDRVARSMERYSTPLSINQHGNIIGPYDRKPFKMVFSLYVDKQGNIGEVKVIESSGVENIDSIFSTALKKARFKPFAIKGQLVNGRVTIPIVFNQQ